MACCPSNTNCNTVPNPASSKAFRMKSASFSSSSTRRTGFILVERLSTLSKTGSRLPAVSRLPLSHDRQAHACAFVAALRIQTLEHLKNAVARAFRNTNAIVLKPYLYPRWLAGHRLQFLSPNPHFRMDPGRHKLDGVAQQIGNHLRQGRVIREHQRQPAFHGNRGFRRLE